MSLAEAAQRIDRRRARAWVPLSVRCFALRPLIVAGILSLLLGACAYKRAMRAGDAAMQSQRYEEALGYYQAALARKPDSKPARWKLSQAQGHAVRARIATGEAKLSRRDLAGAVADAEVAVAISPSNPTVRSYVASVVSAVVEEVEGLSASGVHAKALELAEVAFAALPTERVKLDAVRVPAAKRWAAALADGASAAQEASRPADALLSRAMLAELASITGDSGLAVPRDRILADLKARSTFRVAQTQTRDATAAGVAARLVGPAAPRWLEVLAPGSPQAATATLAFAVTTPHFRTDTTTRVESIRYQSGTQQVPNPAYDRAHRDLVDQERRVTEAEKAVSTQEAYVTQYRSDVAREGPSPNHTTGAEQNLSGAESRLASASRTLQAERTTLQQRRDALQRTPTTITQPVYSTGQYTVTTHTLSASSKLTGTLTPTDGAKIAIAAELSSEARDDAHEGFAAAGVAADPLQLPAKPELEARLGAAAEAELRRRIDAAFEAYRQALRAPGGSVDAQVERAVLYLLMDPRSEDSSADALIERARGIPRAGALLRKLQAP